MDSTQVELSADQQDNPNKRQLSRILKKKITSHIISSFKTRIYYKICLEHNICTQYTSKINISSTYMVKRNTTIKKDNKKSIKKKNKTTIILQEKEERIPPSNKLMWYSSNLVFIRLHRNFSADNVLWKITHKPLNSLINW